MSDSPGDMAHGRAGETRSLHSKPPRQTKWGVRVDRKLSHAYDSVLIEPIPPSLTETAATFAHAAWHHRSLSDAIRAQSLAA